MSKRGEVPVIVPVAPDGLMRQALKEETTMARIKWVSNSPEFSNLSDDSRRLGETNDCGVKAVALLCDVSYNEAHEALRKLGRKSRKGTAYPYIRQAINDFGFEIVEWRFMDLHAMIRGYPGVHVNLQNITTHHPRRFTKAWEPYKNKRLMLCCKKHVAAFRHGEVVDWTVNRSMRVWRVWEVVKK